MTPTFILRRLGALRFWQNCAAQVAIVVAIATPASAQLQLVPYVSGLSAPVEFVQDPTMPSVQFVVEQAGRIRVIQNGVLLPTPFLDISADISSGGERGLLGLAFSPDYAVSRRFFVDFTNPNGNTVVARFKRSANDSLTADPTTRFDLRWHGQPFIVQPFANHNGGHLAFGPDGYLYVALGDGGSGDDPFNEAQRPDTLLGKLLRINVLVGDTHPEGYVVPGDNPFLSGAPIAALPEIWAFGVRNPWKFSFDEPALGGTGAMLIGDVGQNAYEEVDYQPPGAGGRNYGWRVREGVHDYIASPGPAYLPLVQPIVEYDHTVGNSITGGFVYRGYSLGAAYRGRYFYADFGTGRVWSVALIPAGGGEVSVVSAPTEHTAELGGAGAVGNVSAFGMDAVGELYIVSYFSGRILKITTPRVYPPLTASDIDGDHKADPVVWRPSTGAWLGTRSSDGGSLDRLWGGGYPPYDDLPVPGDYDGDGKTDIAIWRPSSGVWYISRSSDGATQTVHWGGGVPPYNDVPVPGDYDGDGITDIAVWRPTDGTWYIRRSSNGTMLSKAWGGGFLPYNDTPVPGDYDGDGKTDIAIWRPSDGSFWVSRSSDGGLTNLQWGGGYAPFFDQPVTGDFDGDGKTDFAIWRPSEGMWYVRQSATGTLLSVHWGGGFPPYNDVPVTGDFDGDGKTDIAIWRPGEGSWYVRRSSNGTMLQLLLGAPGNVP